MPAGHNAMPVPQLQLTCVEYSTLLGWNLGAHNTCVSIRVRTYPGWSPCLSGCQMVGPAAPAAAEACFFGTPHTGMYCD